MGIWFLDTRFIGRCLLSSIDRHRKEMSRIMIDSFMSTKAWQFDEKIVEENERWSYSVFGNTWRDACVYRRLKGRSGEKWIVLWSIDNNVTTVNSEKLCLENKIPSQQKQFSDNLENEEILDSEDDPDYDAADEVEQESTTEKENEELTARVDVYYHHAVGNTSLSSVEKAAQSSNTGALENIVQDSNSEATSEELTYGKEVYLCLPNNELSFGANYRKDGDTVHGHATAKNQARFFITSAEKLLKMAKLRQ